jgi:hypothetical protein
MNTPWGYADSVKEVGLGILQVSTPGHGGFFVPKKHLHRIPTELQHWAACWSGSAQWYEEDCCYTAVVVHFAELFPPYWVKRCQEFLQRNGPRQRVDQQDLPSLEGQEVWYRQIHWTSWVAFVDDRMVDEAITEKELLERLRRRYVVQPQHIPLRVWKFS